MGQGIPIVEPIQAPTLEVIDQNIQILFGQQSECTKPELVNQPIIIISRDISQRGSFQKRQGGFHVNETLLKCIYHQNFQKTIKNLIVILSKELKSIIQAKLIATISRQKFRKCLNIANFCIFFTDENLLQTINLLSVRSDLDPVSRTLVLEFTKAFPQINQSLIDTLQKDFIADLSRILRISMNLMIQLHLKLLTRSDFTLKIIDKLNQSLFVLYTKIILQSQHKDISNREQCQNSKTLLRIGGYFLGLGLESKTASIYQLAVLLLQTVLEKYPEEVKNQKALPSHLFKSLPIISNNQMMQWIANNLLFALKYVKNGPAIVSKLNINRIPSLKLLIRVFQHYKPHGNQITYLLEQICLQTKAHQIERVFVCSLAELYAKLDAATDIIKKYAQVGHISYNVKGNSREVKIKPEDVRTELESDQDTIRKEVAALSAKYTIHVIFQKREVYYEYSDKSLWNMILYQMEEEGELIKEAAHEPKQFNKEGEEEHEEEQGEGSKEQEEGEKEHS